MNLEIMLLVSLSALLVMLNLVGVLIRSVRFQFAATLVVTLMLACLLFWMASANLGLGFAGLLNVNVPSLFFAAIFTFGILLCNLMGYSKDVQYSNFAVLSTFVLIGSYLVAFAGSLVTIFIGLELLGLSTIFAALLGRRLAIEASVKLFIMSAVAIGLFSFGMVLVYGSVGSVALVNATKLYYLMLIALAVLAVSLSFDAALFPFSLWVPDVFQGAPSHVTAMLGGVNKKVGFLALIEIMFFLFFAYKAYFMEIFYVLAILSMFYGNLAALMQRNVKRMIAYSSIGQAGYIAIGLAVASTYAIEGMLFHIFAHMLMFIGAMAVILFMEGRGRNEINDYIGLHKENWAVALCFAVIMLSMIGTPLTMGFVGKFLLFSGAVYANLLALALVGVVNSMISVYYYIKVISAMYTDKADARHLVVGRNVLAVMAVCTILIILLGVDPNLVLGIARQASFYIT
ncbi:MAG: NADH-quinone oxidoreductase subunit N [Candidatus Micrarchaeota archaeon]|nr:NADH-quinone oxidoreductase subunit N [Candidatus Micrarchaeota archaeon]MDE1848105.1 NADH-quinone oxidoreductase subunit N [Candidatus Micrarchaeota archaeon]MDE1864767.1 NADH-quinone oxidoreductase subunit N [Candidatus Micrarchaeota archaeon]